MNVLDRYLTIVPLPVLLLLLVGIGVVALALPVRLRLPLAIFLLPIWLTLSQAEELGTIKGVATATTGPLYIFVALAALMETTPKRRIPGLLWLYPLLGLYSLFLCMTTVDRVNALVLQSHWVLLTVMTIVVGRTIIDWDTLRRVLYPLALGIAVALLIPLTDLMTSGEGVFRRVGRFFPWGANPNQMGLLFSMAIPMGTYIAMTSRRMTFLLVWAVIVAMAGAMAMITASRSVLIVAAIPLIPLLIALTKRPFASIVAIVVAMFAGMFVLRGVTGQFERLASLESGRWGTISLYLDVIADRPLTGLLGTSGQYYLIDPSIGMHMHNAYLFVLYHGGVLYFLPYLAFAVYTLYCTFRVWTQRTLLPHNPTLTSLLVFSTLAVYAHGFVNMSIYYSTYLWAFWHVLLSCLMISWWSELKQVAWLDSAQPVVEDPHESESFGLGIGENPIHGSPAYRTP